MTPCFFFCRAQLLFSTIVARVSPLPEALSVSKMVLSVSAPSWRGGVLDQYLGIS